MRYSFYIFFLFYWSGSLSAQSQEVEAFELSLDSLSNNRQYQVIIDTVAKNNLNTPYINLLLAESQYMKGYNAKAIDILDTLYTDDFRIEDKSRFAFNKGLLYQLDGKYQLSLHYRDTSLMYLEHSDGALTIGDIHTARGNSYLFLADISSAVDQFQKSVEYFEREGLIESAMISKMSIAALYIETRNYNKSIQVSKVILKYFKENDPENPYLTSLYTNLGISYLYFDTDSSEHYLRLAKPFLAGPDTWSYHNSIANTFIRANKLDSAKVHIEEANRVATLYDLKEDLNYSTATNCLYLLKSNKEKEAVKCYENIKPYFISSESLLAKKEFLKHYTIANYSNTFKSSDLKDYFQIADSLENDNIRLQIDNATSDLKTKLINDSLSYVKNETIVLEKSNKRQRSLLMVILALAATMLMGGFYVFIKITNSRGQIQLLNRELNHRVKNNLAFLTSLLEMQGRRTSSKETKEILKESEHRLRALSRVHANLRSGDTTKIELKEYLEGIVKHLKEVFDHTQKSLSIDSQFDKIYFDAESAMRVGLIINELITNSVKHVSEDQVNIWISVKESSNDVIKLEYKDNGSGIERHLHAPNYSENMGLHLIRLLVDQLKGKVDVLLA